MSFSSWASPDRHSVWWTCGKRKDARPPDGRREKMWCINLGARRSTIIRLAQFSIQMTVGATDFAVLSRRPAHRPPALAYKIHDDGDDGWAPGFRKRNRQLSSQNRTPTAAHGAVTITGRSVTGIECKQFITEVITGMTSHKYSLSERGLRRPTNASSPGSNFHASTGRPY